jgi:tetratricopeptide (TPR) repeat protein
VRCAVPSRQVARAESRLRELPPSAATHIGLGLLFFNSSGRVQEALQEVRLALEMDQRSRRALLLGAEIQEASEDGDAVRGLAEAVLRLYPGDAEAEAFLASARLLQGAPDDALDLARRLLERVPRQTRALQVAAIACAARGDRDEARAFFEQLVEAEPGESSHRTNLGIFELESGRPERAARLFQAALDLDPDSRKAAGGLEAAAKALGDPALEAQARRFVQ